MWILSVANSNTAAVIRNTGEQNNKYILANNYITGQMNNYPNITNEELGRDISNALRAYAIDINGQNVRGGKNGTYKKGKGVMKKNKISTKKLRHKSHKQKGGFLYGNKKTSSTIPLTISNKTPSTQPSTKTQTTSNSSKSKNKNTNKNKRTKRQK